jgi:hypothetical protein
MIITLIKITKYYSNYIFNTKLYNLTYIYLVFKFQTFYLQFLIIFQSQFNKRISLLYQHFNCEHHLISDSELKALSRALIISGLISISFAK